jgi:hypothetical protein
MPLVSEPEFAQRNILKQNCLWRSIYSLCHSKKKNCGAESWEANSRQTSQEITRGLWNPKVYYHVYKNSPPVHVVEHVNSVHNLTSLFLNIHFKLLSHLRQGLSNGFFF